MNKNGKKIFHHKNAKDILKTPEIHFMLQVLE